METLDEKMKSAVFAFWWEGARDNGEPIAFFNVTSNDKGWNNGSTVDEKSLNKIWGIETPPHPTYRDWAYENFRNELYKAQKVTASCLSELNALRLASQLEVTLGGGLAAARGARLINSNEREAHNGQ